MAGDVERVLASIDARIGAAERQARAFRVPVLDGADPEDLADGVVWLRPDHGPHGVPYVGVGGTGYRVLTSGSTYDSYNDVNTSQTTTSTSYTDLATVGPTVTITQSGGLQRTLIIVSGYTWSSATGHLGFMSWEVSDTAFGGSYTFPPADVHSAYKQYGTANDGTLVTRVSDFGMGGGTGDPDPIGAKRYTVTAKYRSNNGNSVAWQNRRLLVVQL